MPINYKQYPHNWHTTIQSEVVKRSGNKCETCGREHGSLFVSIQVKKWNGRKWVYRREWISPPKIDDNPTFKIVKVILSIAHINHDHLNHNIQLRDLIHECQLCHLRRDSYMKARRKACGKFCAFPQCGAHTCQQFNPPP